AGQSVVLGTGVPLTASATLAGGDSEGGTLTFTLYDPQGQLVSGATQTVQVSGNGTYTTPPGYLPTTAGAYQWVVSYSGDRDNQGAGPVNAGTPEVAVGPGETVGGTALYLVGGNTNDQVTVTPSGVSRTGSSGTQVNAKLNGVDYGSRTYGQSFTAIYVVGFDGNDSIKMDANLTIATVISEGNGNDVIELGNGSNTV